VIDFTTCPDCGLVAEVIQRYVLRSTDGPVEHLRIHCAGGHYFNMPAASLSLGKGAA
jgi:hypothetical protein